MELSSFGCCQDCQHKADDPVNASVAKWHTREVHVHPFLGCVSILSTGIQMVSLFQCLVFGSLALLFTYVHIWQAHLQINPKMFFSFVLVCISRLLCQDPYCPENEQGCRLLARLFHLRRVHETDQYLTIKNSRRCEEDDSSILRFHR